MVMDSGKKNEQGIDPLTAWTWSAHQILVAVYPGRTFDDKKERDNMRLLMEALDQGKIDLVLSDPGFMSKTEKLLLSLLRGKRIEVADPLVYAARKPIFAAAQVIYNQAVARGFWPIHPEIRKAIQDTK